MDQNTKTILIIIITALIVGIGVYAWQNYTPDTIEVQTLKQTPSAQTQEQEQAPVVEEPLTEMPRTWSTYQNQEYNFSIDYPRHWIIEEEEYSGEMDSNYLFKIIKIKSSENIGCSCGGPADPEAGHMISILIRGNKDNKSLQDLQQEKVKFEDEQYNCSVSEIRTVGDKEMLYYENCPDCCAWYPGYMYVKGDYIYDFYSTYWPTEFEFGQMFDEIIKTVKIN